MNLRPGDLSIDLCPSFWRFEYIYQIVIALTVFISIIHVYVLTLCEKDFPQYQICWPCDIDLWTTSFWKFWAAWVSQMCRWSDGWASSYSSHTLRLTFSEFCIVVMDTLKMCIWLFGRIIVLFFKIITCS
jgi:hypothetical protein